MQHVSPSQHYKHSCQAHNTPRLCTRSQLQASLAPASPLLPTPNHTTKQPPRTTPLHRTCPLHLISTSQPGLLGEGRRATNRSGCVHSGSWKLTGASPWRFLKFMSLRRAMASSCDSGSHSLWMWARPDHLTRYSGS